VLILKHKVLRSDVWQMRFNNIHVYIYGLKRRGLLYDNLGKINFVAFQKGFLFFPLKIPICLLRHKGKSFTETVTARSESLHLLRYPGPRTMGEVRKINNSRGQQCVWLPTYTFYAPSPNFQKRLLPLSCLSVCQSACKNSVHIGRIFMKYGI
jgi:hypothetical protein